MFRGKYKGYENQQSQNKECENFSRSPKIYSNQIFVVKKSSPNCGFEGKIKQETLLSSNDNIICRFIN